jgi:hypothetical protein
MDRLNARLERKMNKIESIHEAGLFKRKESNTGHQSHRKSHSTMRGCSNIDILES